MPTLMPNCLISTSRSGSSTVQGVNITGPAAAVLVGMLAHIEPTRSETDILMDMPAGALRTEVVAYFAPGTDIRQNDFVTAITLLDGLTPWPILGLVATPKETFYVSQVNEGTPGPLAQRQAVISRYMEGGQIYT